MAVPVGRIGTVDVRLAAWLENPSERYSRRHIPVDPDDDRVASDVFGATGDRQVKVWRQSSWRGGEGERVWDPSTSRFWQGKNIRTEPDGTGLVLGPRHLFSRQDNDADNNSDVDFVPESKGAFFIVPDGVANINALGWIDDTNSNSFDSFIDADGGWDADGAHTTNGFAAAVIFNAVPHDDGTDILIAIVNNVVQWDPFSTTANNGTWDVTTGTDWRLIGWVGGALLVRVDNRLYEIHSLASPGTGTLRDEVDGLVGSFGVATDVGAAWVASTHDGEAFIREYNVGSDTAATTGKIPGRGQAWDMLYAHGFVFVLWKPAESDAPSIYFQRGGINGLAGPIRFVAGGYHAAPAISPRGRFVGPGGDDLVFLWDDALWVYNLTEGALFLISEGAGPSLPQDPAAIATFLYDNRAFVAGSTRTEMWVMDRYTTDDAWVEHGAVDFQYPGLDKILLDVTVVTDPLTAGSAVTVAVSVDEAAYVTLAGTHNTVGATSRTFVASTDVASTVGKSFRIKVMPDTTDPDLSPVIRAVSARATGAAHRVEWVLAVDAGTAGTQESAALIDALNLLAATRAVVELSDPWQNPDSAAPDVFDVTVEEVITPERYTSESGDVVATVRLRAVTLL